MLLHSKYAFCDIQFSNEQGTASENCPSVGSLRVAGSRHRHLGAPTPRATLEHVAVMQNAVQHGGDGRHVAQQLAPVLDRAV